MIHLGDITKMPFDTPPVDCITFGSPCQDLSIAGNRAGLAGERSGLFMSAVKVIKNMLVNTFGQYPKFAVWENVPGAFSSNKGEDFRVVLEELARIKDPEVSIPRPDGGKWAKAGLIAGYGWSIAWRTFDAQFWGVPQRRKRIALVMDFGGQRAGEILFERQGVSGHIEPSIPPWQGVARNPANCADGYAIEAKQPVTYPGVGITSSQNASNPKPGDPCHTLNTDSRNYVIYPETARSLTARYDSSPCVDRGQNVICLQRNMIGRSYRSGPDGTGYQTNGISYTLTGNDIHGVCLPINDKATRYKGGGSSRNHDGSGNGLGVGKDTDPMFTLTTGDLHAVCCAAFTAGQGAKANGIGYSEEQAPTLRTDGGLNAMPTVLCRAHGQSNAETLTECSPTLNCNHEQPIVFESHSQDARYTQQENTSPACTAQWGTGGNNMPLVAEKSLTPWDNQARRVYPKSGKFPSLSSRESAGQNQQAVLTNNCFRRIVRRLTPTECERLQGFPDGWTNIPEWVDSRGKLHKAADSLRYKALGNSIALPQWWWITCKMAFFLPEHATLGSLFDGIGGFPLVWETRHGKDTAVWASEIEPFPIAVTKYHFGGKHDERKEM